MKKNITNRKIQAQNTRDKVYNTAIKLIDEKGFENITVEDICKKAEVSVGTFYNCFKSKNDILTEIYKRADEYFKEVVAVSIDAGNYVEKIVQYFKYYADYNISMGISHAKQMFNTHNKLFIQKGRYMQNLLNEIIQNAQKDGILSSEINSEEIVQYLFIAARGVVFDWCLHDGSYDLSLKMVNYIQPIIKIFCN